MRNLLLSAIFAAATIATAATAADFSGTYTVRGTTLEGDRYDGTAEITMTSDDTCRMVWHTGGAPITGFCMWNGDTLAASYTMDNEVGLVIYRIKDNGALDGVWTIADQNGVGNELLIPQ